MDSESTGKRVRPRQGALLSRIAGQAFAIQVLGAVLTFTLQWALARILEVERYGVYVYAVTWIRLLVLPARLGLDRAALRFLPEHGARGELGLLRGFLRRSHQIVAMTSAGAMLLTAAAVWIMRREMDAELARALYVASLSLPVMSMLELQTTALRGFKRVAFGLAQLDLVRPALLLAMALAGAFLLDDFTAPVALALHLVANALVLLTTSIALRREARVARRHAPEYRTREWLAVALPLMTLAGFNLLLKQTDILMVGSLIDPAAAGVYAVASRIPQLIAYGLAAVNSIMAPLISELHASRQMEELQRLTTYAARRIFVFTAAASVAALVAARPILELFGPGFSDGVSTLRILVLANGVNAVAGSVGQLLTMTGHQGAAVRLVGASAALNILLNLALIPIWGIVGAAIATTVSTIVWNAAAVITVRRRLGIHSLVR